MDRQRLVIQLGRGAFAGAAATAPMTVVMEALRRAVSGSQPDPFVPRQVAEGIARQTNLFDLVDRFGEPGWWALTVSSHFGYGAAAGSFYGLMDAEIHSSRIEKPSPARVAACGAAFGLVIWAVSYIGLLPALGIIQPQTERPIRKNFVLIVSHLVWGVTTAVCYGRGRAAEKRSALRSVRSLVVGECESHITPTPAE